MTLLRYFLLAFTVAGMCHAAQAGGEQEDVDVIIVGAGISGLSAAVAAGRAGIDVLVVDMNSVPGGHAVLAGGTALVGTPVQKTMGYEDTPDRAFEDWMAWTEGTADPWWTRFYAEHSLELIHDWLAEMGVEFVRAYHGNGDSVPRFHLTENNRAVDIILALFRTLLGMPNVAFQWNKHVIDLVVENNCVTGIRANDLRTGESYTRYASHTVLATGGFEGNLQKVLASWPAHLPEPDRLLIGASVHAKGEGLDLAEAAGGTVTHLDRQYIYVNGMIDPRDPQEIYAITASNPLSLWLNAQGKRFTNETGPDKRILEDLLAQAPSSYWMIFDEGARRAFKMRGREWVNNPMQAHPILDNPEAARKAESLEELARQAGLPVEIVRESVSRFNALIQSGRDADYGRWNEHETAPPQVDEPPYYAVQMFPMARKSMGGVRVDRRMRVLNDQGDRVPGLYAVGELTGSVGINGQYGLDGMFIGPAILTGHLAGLDIAGLYDGPRAPLPATARETSAVEKAPLPLDARDLKKLLNIEREGYWHFQKSHKMVLSRQYPCARCHSDWLPQSFAVNRQALRAKSDTCLNCHN